MNSASSNHRAGSRAAAVKNGHQGLATPPDRSPVTIDVYAHVAYAKTVDLPLLKPILEQSRLAFKDGEEEAEGLRCCHGRLLYYHVIKGRVVIATGLVARIVQRLRAQGLKVKVKHLRHWPHFDSADNSLLDALGSGTRQDFLAAVRGKPKGQIAVQRAADIPELIALLGRYYRDANVFVVCKNKRSIRSLTRQLKPIAGRFVTRHVDQRLWRESPRMYVGSISDFSVTNPDGWQVVIFADVESATASWTLQHAAYLPCLYFAFVPAQDLLDDRQRMDLESVAGPEIFRLVQEPVTFTTVRVVPVGPFAYPAMATEGTPLERKRTALWHNGSRNQAIAQIARALAARDMEALRRHGIEREDAPRFWPRPARPLA